MILSIDIDKRYKVTNTFSKIFGTGDSMTSLYYSYRISLTSVSNIIRETTRVLWDVLFPRFL
ncbi:hypothetical protein NQ315_000830 [Exocentrus adspersus]|uniref:Uncharacterized protein n=1 Tax=Exocentrus adspersus TaxID=1586481 RepID=A0AAV8WDP7_9CUCU|nr:hypothetical protein NQ315_000830 [Exocentrus adspersus]